MTHVLFHVKLSLVNSTLAVPQVRALYVTVALSLRLKQAFRHIQGHPF